MEIRKAQAKDFESLIELQNANLADNLSPEQKQDGFLSGGFDAGQLKEMNDDLGISVAVDEGRVKAFLCASTVQFANQFALPKAMIDRFPHAKYESRPLSHWAVFIAGPACIDASLRGQGVLKKLYDCLHDWTRASYEVVTIFVAKSNSRSIKAHEKVGMKIVDQFNFNSQQYMIMATRIS